MLNLKINVVRVVGDGGSAVAPGESEQVALVVHGVGSQILVDVSHALIVGQQSGVNVHDQTFVMEPLGVVVGQNHGVDGLVAAGHQSSHQLFVGVEIDVLHGGAGGVLKCLFAVVLVGVITLPVGDIQGVACIGLGRVGGLGGLGGLLLGLLLLGTAAGGQRQNHSKSQQQCKKLLHDDNVLLFQITKCPLGWILHCSNRDSGNTESKMISTFIIP